MGGLTGFSSLMDGYARADPSGIGDLYRALENWFWTAFFMQYFYFFYIEYYFYKLHIDNMKEIWKVVSLDE